MRSPALRRLVAFPVATLGVVAWVPACGSSPNERIASGSDASASSMGPETDASINPARGNPTVPPDANTTSGKDGAAPSQSGGGDATTGGSPVEAGVDATDAGDSGLQASRDCGTSTPNAEASLAAPLIDQLSNDSNFPSGEPWLAIDPQNPQIVIATWTTIGLNNYCGLARSTDGGKTWTQLGQQGVWGSRQGPVGDPALGVAPDGTFYVLCSYAASTGEYVLIQSSDGGMTWSQPAAITEGAGTYNDRPDLIVDSITGDVYVSASDNSTNGRGISVSTDHGSTWSKFQPFAPGLSAWGDRIAAAGGVLAAGYTFDPSGSQPAPSGVSCSGPCVVFQTSTDHGMTWSRQVVPAQNIVTGSSAGGPRIHVAVDPMHTGHYAVLVPANSQSTLEVWVTADGGMHWVEGKTLDAPMGDQQQKWAMAYSPTGALGIVWRTVYSDGTYDVSAVVAADGATFGATVPLTTNPSAASGIGDDCACNAYLDPTSFATSWGDSRSGNREAWFARITYATNSSPSTCN